MDARSQLRRFVVAATLLAALIVFAHVVTCVVTHTMQMDAMAEAPADAVAAEHFPDAVFAISAAAALLLIARLQRRVGGPHVLPAVGALPAVTARDHQRPPPEPLPLTLCVLRC